MVSPICLNVGALALSLRFPYFVFSWTSLAINGTIGERFDLAFWASMGRIMDQKGPLLS